MKVDRNLILKLEGLAKLDLSEDERKSLVTDLGNILDMVEKLKELDTTGVDPLVYINEEVNRLRKDEIANQVSREEALKNAPEQDGVYFKVPKVLK